MQIVLARPACTPPLVCVFYFGKRLLGRSVFQCLKENVESCNCPGVPSRKQVGGSASADVNALCGSEKHGVTKLPVPRGGVGVLAWGCWRGVRGSCEGPPAPVRGHCIPLLCPPRWKSTLIPL